MLLLFFHQDDVLLLALFEPFKLHQWKEILHQRILNYANEDFSRVLIIGHLIICQKIKTDVIKLRFTTLEKSLLLPNVYNCHIIVFDLLQISYFCLLTLFLFSTLLTDILR